MREEAFSNDFYTKPCVLHARGYNRYKHEVPDTNIAFTRCTEQKEPKQQTQDSITRALNQPKTPTTVRV